VFGCINLFVKATSALDTLTENSIQEALLALGRDRTVLIIAHRLSTIRHAQQIVVMDQGCVAEVGSHEELIAKPDGLYSRMWAMQVHGAASSGSQGVRSSASTESLSPSYELVEDSSDSSGHGSKGGHGK
jgi:ABC-type proline/glycine betaine transport system ATPase subunit